MIELGRDVKYQLGWGIGIIDCILSCTAISLEPATIAPVRLQLDQPAQTRDELLEFALFI